MDVIRFVSERVRVEKVSVVWFVLVDFLGVTLLVVVFSVGYVGRNDVWYRGCWMCV